MWDVADEGSEPASDDGSVVLAVRGGEWRVDPLPAGLLADLDGLLSVLSQQPPDAVAIALADVAGEFFVAARIGAGGRPRLLLSDATAAAEWPLAAQVLDHLGESPPADDDDEVWPAGDLDIFADLGMSRLELGALMDDLDLYADEMLLDIAARLGFAGAYENAVGAAPR